MSQKLRAQFSDRRGARRYLPKEQCLPEYFSLLTTARVKTFGQAIFIQMVTWPSTWNFNNNFLECRAHTLLRRFAAIVQDDLRSAPPHMGCVFLPPTPVIMLILDPHNAQIKYMPQEENMFASSLFFNLEGQSLYLLLRIFQS